MVTEPIRDKRQLKALAGYWLKRGNIRNYTLIVLGVCTALRISDLLRLTWDDVYKVNDAEGGREDPLGGDEVNGTFRTHVTLTERKTGKQKVIALNKQAIQALQLLYPHKRGAYIFVSNRKDEKAISRVQAWRIVKEAAIAVKIHGCISCYSLRKSAGYHWWKSGALPVLLMDIFNHSSFEITKRYLGIAQDDRDKIYMRLALF